MPLHRATSPGSVKLSAAWMIEQCGWKGYRDGDAGVHAAHALVLVNHGRATGAQILALAERIRTSVRERFGVDLEREPAVV
jgi:UDP-N-acetylmuramate dehydrogenase